jgi:hypothetical protein
MEDMDCCARCPCLKRRTVNFETYAQCDATGRTIVKMSDPKAHEWLMRVDPSCPYWDDEEEYDDRD